jgi:hypothetical protein
MCPKQFLRQEILAPALTFLTYIREGTRLKLGWNTDNPGLFFVSTDKFWDSTQQ